MKLSPHFNRYEFECHCNKCEMIEPPKELLSILEDVRSYFSGRPVTIISGYRCKKHNKKVDGKRRSKHKLGIAADITVSGIAPRQVQKYLLGRYPNRYGIGKYSYFTHIDVRGYKARW